jgi:hypothetical protein
MIINNLATVVFCKGNIAESDCEWKECVNKKFNSPRDKPVSKNKDPGKIKLDFEKQIEGARVRD